MSLRTFALVEALLTTVCQPLTAQSNRRAATESISIRVSEGTRLSFDVSSDGRSIVFDLLGQLWLVPAQGGAARSITDAVRDTAEDLDPSFSPDGRRIVFRAERNGARGLWLLERGADRPHQLTQLPNQFAYEGGTAWSPDGKIIAFAREVESDSAGGPSRSSIVLLDVASRAMRELRIEGLPKSDLADPAWTPDGERIAFVARGATNNSAQRIWIVNVAGGKATPLTGEKGQPLAPAIAPDGRFISYFAPDATRRMQVWVQNISAGADRVSLPPPLRLTNHTDVAPTRIRWSADGKTLLYSADGRLWRVPAAGGRALEIPFTAQLAFTRPRRALLPARFPLPGETQPARAFMGLALSPDATRIGAIALGKLWVIPVGGSARAIVDVPHTARHLAWSADGTEVAWSAGDFEQEDLFATTLATGTTRRLTSLPGREVFPAYSPDGRHLSFAHAPRSGPSQLRVAPTGGSVISDTSQTRTLGEMEVPWTASNVDAPVWTPDSDGLLFPGSWETNAPTLGVIRSLSKRQDTLKRFPEAPTFVQWTARNSIVFLRHDRLWQAPFDRTGMLAEPSPLGEAPALYASAARDGTVIFISEGGLRVRSPDGTERRLGWPVTYTVPVAPPVLIRNVRIIDGTGALPTSPRDVLIMRGRIARIAAAGTLAAGDARIVDAKGRFAIPGLMDLHAHTYRPDLLPGFVYFGVTTVRDQGSSIAPLVAYSDAINAGLHPGPRVTYGGFQFYSDWPFDEEQGRGIEPEADPDHVKRSVALAEAFGAQHIKTRTFRRWDINSRMIAEAHRRGMRATGHCAYPLPLIAAGIDAKEHIGLCPSRGGGFVSGMYTYDDMIQLFRAAGVSVVPTISYFALAARLNANPKLLETDAELAPFLLPSEDFNWMLKMSAEARDQHTLAAQVARDATAKLARAGVTIGTGTDIWQAPTGVHMELEQLVAAGLSPLAAIRASTADAARIIGAETNLGTIEVGKLADLVLLDANPLQDIRNTRRIWAVVQSGRMVDRNALRKESVRARRALHAASPFPSLR